MSSSRVQQRVSSQAAILDAAISAYGDAGPNGVSLRDVANSAGVTHPLISQYFDSKDGLLAAVGDELAAYVTTEIEAVRACDAEGFSRLLRAARDEPSMTKLLIRSALGDLSPIGFPGCLGGPWSSQDARADDDAARRVRICHYAASSLLLGWLTFEGFVTSAIRLDDMSERRRDDVIATVVAHLWALAETDEPTLEPRRIAIAEPVARQISRTSERSTRDTLLASAIELFALRGPASVSIRDVARHAGLNHGLLHRHFGSKDALIAEAIEVGVGSLLPGALAPGGFDIDQVVQVMHEDPIPARLIARTVVDDIDIASVRDRYPVMDGVLALARRVPAESRPQSAADPRIAAVAAASMVAGSVIWGPALQDAWGFHDEVQSAMADLTRHLLGRARGRFPVEGETAPSFS
jgi:TetR/AcrR family transcriptional regulator, repressor for neighboring sulfatase